MKKKISQKNKGITLIETIVSMALVVIISLVAFLTLSYSNSAMQKIKEKNFFINCSQNFVSAYFMGSGDYEKSLKLITGQDYAYGENTTIYFDNKFKIANQENCEYKVLLNFDEQIFSVNCTDSSNVSIYSVEV